MGDQEKLLDDLVRARAKSDGAAWLSSAIAELRAGSGDVGVMFPAVSRRVGRVPLEAPGGAAVNRASLAAWRVDDAARVLLVLAVRDHDPAGAIAAAVKLYFDGDSRERIGVLRALPFFGEEDGALPALLDALRVSQGAIFEAAVCDNDYASRHLPELEFRKAVLKCVFTGLSITRVARIEERADQALCQSLLDYVEEREAATRPVSPELWPIMAISPPPGTAAKLLGYLEHPNPGHRAAAARALNQLIRAGDQRLVGFVEDRGRRETEPEVKRAIAAEPAER